MLASVGDGLVSSLNQIRYFRRKMLDWGRSNFRNFPWRTCKNKWHCLVAEIMLQRTKAEQVEPVFLDFTEKYQEPQAYLDDLEANTFMNLGLPQRNKQFRLLNSAIVLHGLSHNKADLVRLPGVGDYIASAFLSLHVGIRASLIDSNIVRVYGRFFGFETDPETRRKQWLKELAESITPKHRHKEYNYSLIDFSREICKPRPNCEKCPIRRKCNHYAILKSGRALWEQP